MNKKLKKIYFRGVGLFLILAVLRVVVSLTNFGDSCVIVGQYGCERIGYTVDTWSELFEFFITLYLLISFLVTIGLLIISSIVFAYKKLTHKSTDLMPKINVYIVFALVILAFWAAFSILSAFFSIEIYT